MASITGTMRGQRQTSWRPSIFSVVSWNFPSLSAQTVFCSLKIEGTGFTATLKKISLPFDIPPRMPPALFVRKLTFVLSSLERITSLFVLPVKSAASKPAPNSIPFTAPMLKTACAKTASSLSKTHSPSPAGTPLTVQAIIPPAESPCFLSSSILSFIFAAASLSGARNGFCSI